MEKELPKIDLPEEWLVGIGISKELLGLYRNYPVRLKCEIFVLCTSGEVEASVNLNKITVEPTTYRTYPRKYLSDKRHQGRPEHLLRRILFSVYGTQSSVAFFSGYDVHHTGASRYQSKAGRRQNDGGVHAAAYQDV